MTDATHSELEVVVDAPPAAAAAAPASQPLGLAASPGALMWIGLGVVALGLVVIVLAWGRVAGMVDVSRQLPYVVSGGCGGLALVFLGLATVTAAARRQDALERAQQTQQLDGVLGELRQGGAR